MSLWQDARHWLQDARRWLKDQSSYDEHITVSPKTSIREAEKHLSRMNGDERTRTLNHLKAYADLYYHGRHNENVPVEVRGRLQNLDRWVDRLNTVDRARQIVAQYGGPPTKQTFLDSLSRTYKQRVVEEYNRQHAAQHAPAQEKKSNQQQTTQERIQKTADNLANEQQRSRGISR
jgi:hypothetical protein